MMENFTVKELANAIGVEAPFDAPVTSVCSHSKELSEGCAFVAIVGDRFDGHQFVKMANDNGAVVCVTQKPIEGVPCLVCEDTRAALLPIANAYRKKFNPIVVGVTGSVGKTTTKDMIAFVLEEKYRTLKTEGNLNNDIGLPQTLFRLNSSYEAAVVEMGMSDFGEISKLSKAAMPSIGVITNIGWSHIEFLKSRDGILKAKLEILDGMAPDAPLVVCADDEFLSEVPSAMPERRVITYGIQNQSADCRAFDIVEDETCSRFKVAYGDLTADILINAIGTHNILNALAAFAIGVEAGLTCDEIASALAKFRTNQLRQNIVNHNGMKIIVDCYNASPDSMRAALDVLSKVKPGENGRRIAVLGDMLELGELSDYLHYEIGKYASATSTDKLLCYGEKAEQIARACSANGKNAMIFDSCEELAAFLKVIIRKGDVLLFKASRGMHFENLVNQVFGEIVT